jgi:hypothetical protein
VTAAEFIEKQRAAEPNLVVTKPRKRPGRPKKTIDKPPDDLDGYGVRAGRVARRLKLADLEGRPALRMASGVALAKTIAAEQEVDDLLGVVGAGEFEPARILKEMLSEPVGFRRKARTKGEQLLRVLLDDALMGNFRAGERVLDQVVGKPGRVREVKVSGGGVQELLDEKADDMLSQETRAMLESPEFQEQPSQERPDGPSSQSPGVGGQG